MKNFTEIMEQKTYKLSNIFIQIKLLIMIPQVPINKLL